MNRSLLDPLLFLGLLLAALLLELPLPLLLRLLLREEDVGDRYVDLGYAKAYQALHPVGHVAAYGLGELGYRFAVLGRQRQVYGRFFLADLHRDPLGLASTSATARDATEEAALDLTLTAEYGKSIPQLAEAVRRNVANRVESLVGLRVTEVNITVSNIFFPQQEAEQERQRQLEQERREQEAQEQQRVQ